MPKLPDEFRAAIQGVKLPLLVLDKKWYELFPPEARPAKIVKLEKKLNHLLMDQSRKRDELKKLKTEKDNIRKDIIENIGLVGGIEGDPLSDAVNSKMQASQKRILEINEEMEAKEDELIELPAKIEQANCELMVTGMDICYRMLEYNIESIENIDEWLKEVRVQLKKNILIKQNRNEKNRQVYSYMHDVLGPKVADIFDLEFKKLLDHKKS